MERDLFNYSRRETSEVNIGAVPLGGPHPIRIQSMTNTSTQDTEACVEQAKRIVDAGGEYVRLTTQGIKEAENLMNAKPFPKGEKAIRKGPEFTEGNTHLSGAII